MSSRTFQNVRVANARPLFLRLLGLMALVAIALTIAPPGARAAGSSDSGGDSSSYTAPSVSKEMRKAVVLIRQEDYSGALSFLEGEIAKNPDSADAWNLTGFASRKMGNYTASEAAYDKALAINPKHKGALEYKGELYLTLGNLAGAEEMLARLSKACYFSCKEKKQLVAAIEAYKKAN